MLRKKDVILIGSILAVAAVLFGASALMRRSAPQASRASILILLDGKEYARLSLDTPQTLTIDCGDGETNVLVVDAHGMHMQSATCRDQLCVSQGEVTLQNMHSRALGADIICLPHRLVCTLIAEDTDVTTLPVPDA